MSLNLCDIFKWLSSSDSNSDSSNSDSSNSDGSSSDSSKWR